MEQNKNQDTARRGNSALALKAGFWYVFSSFVVKALGFITTPIFARLMDKADYGEFSNFASWLATLGIITGAELYNTLSRAYYDFKEDFDGYASTVTILGAMFTAAMYLVFLFFGDAILQIVTIPPQYVHLLFVMLLFQAVKQVFMARERTLYRYKTVAAMSFANLLIPTLVAVALVVIMPEADRLASRLYGFYVPSAIIGACCGLPILLRGRSFKLSYCKYALALSLPMLAHYFTAYLLTSSNLIVTKSIFGAEPAAVVSIANSTIHILTVFFQSVSGAFTTWMMDNLAQGTRQKLKNDSIFYVIMLAVVASGVIMLAPEVVMILGGSEYAESVYLIPGFVMAVFVQSVTTVFTIILTYDKNITKTAIWTGVIAVLSIVAKVLFLPEIGIMGLPYINIVAFGVLFVINYLLVKQAGYGDAVNMKGILLCFGLVAAVMAASLVLYEHTLVRYGVISVAGIAFLVILVNNKTAVVTLLKQIRKAK